MRYPIPISKDLTTHLSSKIIEGVDLDLILLRTFKIEEEVEAITAVKTSDLTFTRNLLNGTTEVNRKHKKCQTTSTKI